MSGLNQWLQKHRRPRSALYLSSTANQESNKCTDNRRTMSWAQSSSSSKTHQKQQQQKDNHIDEPIVRASLDCGLTIPVRQTSKHYKLDPELQAKVDRVVSSDEIRLISQRVRRQHIQSICSCPTSDIHTATNTTSITLPVQDKEEYNRCYNKQLSQHFHNDPYHQQYDSTFNNCSSHQQSPPPPPPHRFL